MPRAKQPPINLAESPPETSTDPPVVETPPPPPPATAPPAVKPKKVITEKQREALMKGQETRNANRAIRKAENEAKAQAEKKLLEIKLVQKAEQIKKKTEKKLAVIDAISDASEDEDEDIIKPATEKVRPPPTKSRPQAKLQVKKVKKVVVIESDDESTDSEDYARSIDDMDSDEEVVYVAKSHSKKPRARSAPPQPVSAKPIIRFI